tara:strand:- start:109 stop:414 length:306 start_codon:yes stop_codon:yes gene_type:complete
MATKKTTAKRLLKCESCDERVRKFEPIVIGLKVARGKIVDDNKERYCLNCESIAIANCLGSTDSIEPAIDYENRAEKMREAYSSYDNKTAFWNDADLGYFD